MSNEISNELRAQIFKQESEDPFLTLVTISSGSFVYRLVNNTEDISSRSNLYRAFPMKVTLPVDDGESVKDFNLVLDNASLTLIGALRSITSPIQCKIEMILASMPDTVQLSYEDLLIRAINYNGRSITAKVSLDNFLTVAMTSEKYTPSNYPGLF